MKFEREVRDDNNRFSLKSLAFPSFPCMGEIHGQIIDESNTCLLSTYYVPSIIPILEFNAIKFYYNNEQIMQQLCPFTEIVFYWGDPGNKQVKKISQMERYALEKNTMRKEERKYLFEVHGLPLNQKKM